VVLGLGRLSVRSQGLVFVLLTLSVLLGAWQTWLVPERLLRQSQQARVASARSELARLRHTSAGLPALRQEVRALEGRAADSRAAEPAEASEHILDVLNAAAIATGAVLTTFSTTETAKEGSGEGGRVQLALEGGFHEIVRFLAHLASRGRVGGIREITIKRAVTTGGSRTVSASVVAETSSGAAALPLEEIGATSGRDPFHDVTDIAGEKSSAASGSWTAAATGIGGLAALAVDQVTVTGIVRAGDTISAMLQAPNRRTFVGRLNDRLLDATIESIDGSGVTFMSLPGSRAGSPPRPVRKSLGKAPGVVR
jgi:Tfp pilus assembly protein PilO